MIAKSMNQVESVETFKSRCRFVYIRHDLVAMITWCDEDIGNVVPRVIRAAVAYFPLPVLPSNWHLASQLVLAHWPPRDPSNRAALLASFEELIKSCDVDRKTEMWTWLKCCSATFSSFNSSSNVNHSSWFDAVGFDGRQIWPEEEAEWIESNEWMNEWMNPSSGLRRLRTWNEYSACVHWS